MNDEVEAAIAALTLKPSLYGRAEVLARPSPRAGEARPVRLVFSWFDTRREHQWVYRFRGWLIALSRNVTSWDKQQPEPS